MLPMTWSTQWGGVPITAVVHRAVTYRSVAILIDGECLAHEYLNGPLGLVKAQYCLGEEYAPDGLPHIIGAEADVGIFRVQCYFYVDGKHIGP